jgi:hypothetical protein
MDSQKYVHYNVKTSLPVYIERFFVLFHDIDVIIFCRTPSREADEMHEGFSSGGKIGVRESENISK